MQIFIQGALPERPEYTFKGLLRKCLKKFCVRNLNLNESFDLFLLYTENINLLRQQAVKKWCNMGSSRTVVEPTSMLRRNLCIPTKVLCWDNKECLLALKRSLLD